MGKSGPYIFCLVFAILTFLAQDHVFFWDTVQFAGKHGLWFYEQNFRQLLLPSDLDSGHPPVFGWYLALVWSIFGKSLIISHWAMFPFLVGIVWQIFRLARLCLQHIPAYWLALILLADPVFLGQSVLVSPDIVLIFFFLYSLNSVLEGKKIMGALGYLGLAMISMRGMMLVGAFGFYELWREWPKIKSRPGPSLFNCFLPFSPAAVFILFFLGFHYQQTGWIGYHGDSPWAPSFERVDALGFFKNLAVLAWRWLDYGRIFIWVTLLFLFFKNRKNLKKIFQTVFGFRCPAPGKTLKISDRFTCRHSYLNTLIFQFKNRSLPLTTPDREETNDQNSPASKNKPIKLSKYRSKKSTHQHIILLFLMVLFFLSISFLSYRGLQAHRYLLPAFLLFSCLSIILVDRWFKKKIRKMVLPLLLLGLFTGNLWVYPDRIAQGWDSTLAQWPYYALRQQMLTYLEKEKIPINTVGTAFPDIGPLKFRDLSGESVGFKEKDLTNDRWIWYSNVMNDFSDAEIEDLRQDWKEVKRLESWSVKMILYQKK